MEAIAVFTVLAGCDGLGAGAVTVLAAAGSVLGSSESLAFAGDPAADWGFVLFIGEGDAELVTAPAIFFGCSWTTGDSVPEVAAGLDEGWDATAAGEAAAGARET